ncbi:PilN domain-containing protein [Bacillus sp. B-jedd]|uniref:PilN domain-containing protein n=1 Tax=Bacillus sp. B-jedd TaxID=1476857 RepID=UPI0005155A64|nr:PilN domain-containing protein [Bacillus sp. B-jedd]CEG28028.1 Fimbrial assembly family protein [Bacillus sp. B-jedd]
MLIEINLLPKKERKSSSIIFASMLLAVLLLCGGGFFFWQISSLNTDIASVDNRIETTKKIAELEEKKAGDLTAADSAEKLENTIAWAEEYTIPSVPVMQEFSSLLPERGFILSFAYQELGELALTVQFDSSREAAYFLNSLNKSAWVKEASLTSLSAAQADQQAGAADIEKAEKEKEYLPRYTGQFQITLNKQTVKDFVQSQDGEGAGGI